MNNDRINEIRARCEVATPGPWEAGRPDMATYVDGIPSKWIYAGDTYLAISSGYQIEPWEQVMENAAFIAHSREDIPFLIDQLAARDAEIERLRQHENTILIDHSHRFTEAGVRGLLEQIKTFNEVCLEHQQERLQREEEIRQLREAQRWIPVEERLPEVGKCVLVRQTYHAFIGDHGEYEGITVGYLHQPTDKRHMPYFYYAAVSDYGDMVRAESICPGQEFVTHWMPLPAPPKGE